MAITGSGSLAISLSLFVISAAFLPKGESASPFFFLPLLRVSHGCVAAFAGSLFSRLKPGEETTSGGREVAVAFARRDARKLRRESQHHFSSAALWTFRRCCCCFPGCFFRGVVLSDGGRRQRGREEKGGVKKSNISGGFVMKVARVKTE